tara:strand:- start:318 stop:485 length:168 start_codon:yes stop_codon:yes gene_type:complete
MSEDKIDQILEKGSIMSKLIEIADMKIYLQKREIDLRTKLERIKDEEGKSNNHQA